MKMVDAVRQSVLTLAISSAVLFTSTLAAQDDTATPDVPQPISLWDTGAPGSEDRKDEAENVDRAPGKCNVTNVHDPSITPYFPATDDATGTAIIIAPGGGHRVLCLGHEGDALAQWFADHGIAAFVLRYRLAREKDSSYTVDDHAMADTRRAIRMVRNRSEQWGINPQRIGILGFSAGGELAALAAMDSDNGLADAADPIDRASSRPDFQVLIYPGSSDRFRVEKGMPPAFIALGAQDRPDISLGMAQLYLKYKQAEVPCELHIYSNAGHGFGYRPGTTSAAGDWPLRLREWLVDSKFLQQ
ncbi:alpha/beta hydrolase [Stieleria sp. TO1_6]|uniref:alpha/beta hydrolase n=1 Tax=Stieleria tagensis TaxID=2956795 RepID=UPI00209B8871|nr:alpha/beta hydrolase [Stieleria tagensis]MCO8122098.1 alpha/beta hydrolase [Stieleria tagensis]